jgi:hypothetical protein
LKKVEKSEISSGCSSYIALLDSCRADIDEHCAGKEYTNDAIVCLTEWTKVPLSSECAAALPKKVQSSTQRESDKLGSEAKKKADQRRRLLPHLYIFLYHF